MQRKRETADLIPYKIINNKIFVFLQKRDKSAKILPDYFSFFGGKIEEGENKEDAIKREIAEELEYTPKNYEFLGRYESSISESYVLHVYFLKVEDNFENIVKVNEGEYGKFLSEDEAMNEPKLIDGDKKIIKDLCDLLRKRGI